MNKLLLFILILVFLFLLMFILFIIKVNVENVFEGIDKEVYNPKLKMNNTNVSCDFFCGKFSSVPKYCSSFNNDKPQRCLNKNNVPVQPNCTYNSEVSTCVNIA